MLFIRFYDDPLAQASYLIACQVTGEALVVDPLRDADLYLRRADDEGVRITHVTETHIHADFLSGSRELAARAGARLFLSGEGAPDWLYEFAAGDGATLLRDGDAFDVGRVRIHARHTPGHTPEHLAFVVTDTATASAPMGVLTGDFIFVGDVGRPDLLERTGANTGHAPGLSMQESARSLYRSLRAFAVMPDYLQLWPGHGAGSACGKALGAVPQTTLGYEKRFNWAFRARDEAEFIAGVLEGQPAPPRYFARMKRMNRSGPPLLRTGIPRPVALDPRTIPETLVSGAIVVDTRPSAMFVQRHIPGTLAIPLGSSFPTWSGWLLDYDRPIVLIAENAARAAEATRLLALIGLDGIAGAYTAEVVDAWEHAGHPVGSIALVTVEAADKRSEDGSARLLDVRNDDEWNAGHIPGAEHIALGVLPERLSEFDRRSPIIVHCQTGSRAVTAASLLQRAGFTAVSYLAGGYAAWEDAALARQSS